MCQTLCERDAGHSETSSDSYSRCFAWRVIQPQRDGEGNLNKDWKAKKYLRCDLFDSDGYYDSLRSTPGGNRHLYSAGRCVTGRTQQPQHCTAATRAARAQQKLTEDCSGNSYDGASIWTGEAGQTLVSGNCAGPLPGSSGTMIDESWCASGGGGPENCSSSRCCADPALRCYKKDQHWSGCIPPVGSPGACTPGGTRQQDGAEWSHMPWACEYMDVNPLPTPSATLAPLVPGTTTAPIVPRQDPIVPTHGDLSSHNNPLPSTTAAPPVTNPATRSTTLSTSTAPLSTTNSPSNGDTGESPISLPASQDGDANGEAQQQEANQAPTEDDQSGAQHGEGAVPGSVAEQTPYLARTPKPRSFDCCEEGTARTVPQGYEEAVGADTSTQAEHGWLQAAEGSSSTTTQEGATSAGDLAGLTPSFAPVQDSARIPRR